MVTMERKERAGDRARTRIHTPGENVIPTFKDGMVTVRVESERAVKALKRRKHGFVVVETAPPAAPTPPPIDPPKPSTPKTPKAKTSNSKAKTGGKGKTAKPPASNEGTSDR